MRKRKASKMQYIGLLIYVCLVMVPVLGAFMQIQGELNLDFSIRKLELLGNSLKLAFLAAAISGILGFFCSIFIASCKRLTGTIRYYFVGMMPVPFYIYALSWMYGIKLLANWFPSLQKYMASGLGACVFVEVLAFFPIATLFTLIGIDNIDSDTLKMAAVYGDDNKTIIRIMLQTVFPYMLAAFGLNLTLSLTEFSVPSMFQYNTYALDVFSVYSRTGSAVLAYIQSIPLVLVLILPIAWFIGNIKRFGVKASIRDKYYLKPRGILKFLCLLSFVISILQIVIPVVTFVITSKGLENLILSASMISEEFWTSFETAFVTGIISVLMAIIPGRFLAKNSERKAMCILCTIAVPGAIQAMGLLKVINSLGLVSFEKTFIMTSLGCAIKIAPFMVLWFWVDKLRSDQKAFEMAEIFAVRKKDYWKLKLSMEMPGIIAGFSMAFFISFAEESIPIILMAPGKETITVKIYNYLHYGASEYVSAFSLVSLAGILAVELLTVWIYKGLKGAKQK